MSDVVTTYCGALGLTPGAVVAAGTGSIAMALHADGAVTRVDGWGYLLGDEGSGYAIGRLGLRSALRALDGRGGSTVLASLAAERFGGESRISQAVYGAPVPAQVVASFAPDVARAARDGDLEAMRMWEDAGTELARSVVAAPGAAADEPGPTVVSWAGGLFRARDLLLPPFRREVTAQLPLAELREPIGDAVTGARILATQPAPCLPTATLWAGTPT